MPAFGIGLIVVCCWATVRQLLFHYYVQYPSLHTRSMFIQYQKEFRLVRVQDVQRLFVHLLLFAEVPPVRPRR